MEDGYNKLHDKSFLDEIKPSDIVLLTETHVGYDTIVDIEEFNYYPFCRQKSNNNRHFGGLAILINKRIRQGVSILQNGNSEYQWIKLRKNFFNFVKDIFLCLAYIAPASSPFLLREQVNVLENIENDYNT